MKLHKHKHFRGAISIFIIIFVPIMVIGCILIYDLLSKNLLENKAFKITYASSEAYLSKYNEMMFDSFSLFVTLDESTLDQMVAHYYVKNELIRKPQDVEVNVEYKNLANPYDFYEAIEKSAGISAGRFISDYSIGLLNQLTVCEKIRTLHSAVQGYEKKLSEHFSFNSVDEYIKEIRNLSDPEANMQKIIGTLSEKQKNFLETASQLGKEMTTLEAGMDDLDQSVKSFCETKKTEWAETANQFEKNYTIAMDNLSQMPTVIQSIQPILDEIDQINSEILDLEEEQNKINDEMSKSKDSKYIESKRKQLNALSKKISTCEQKVSDLEKKIESMKAQLNKMCDAISATYCVGEPLDLKDFFFKIVSEIDGLISGISIGEQTLKLDEKLYHSKKDTLDISWSLSTKALINEYFLSIFNSYDLNCPRKFGPQAKQVEQPLKTKGHSDNNEVYTAEIEYLITGNISEKESITQVRLKIFAIRGVANLISLFTDRDKVNEITSALSIVPQPWKSIVFGVAALAWSSAESYVDINQLMKGEGFYLIKSSDQWKLDFNTLMNQSWKENNLDAPDLKDKNKKLPVEGKRDIADPKLYYLDYLRMILLMQDENTSVLRAMDLFEYRIQTTTQNEKSLENFSIGHEIEVKWLPQLPLPIIPVDRTSLSFENQY